MLFESIQSSSHIGLFTHINPDGDALGSTIGMMGFLIDLDKDVTLFLPSEVSESLAFMVKPQCRNRIRVYNDRDIEDLRTEISSCDLLIGLDFNKLERIEGFAPLFKESTARKILIDHHVGPEAEYFNEIHSVCDISSTCELLYGLLMDTPAIGHNCSKLSKLTRESLLTGMTTDTNNFANSVYPGTLRMASELLEAGTDRDSIIGNIYFTYPERRLRAQGFLLDKMLKITDYGVGYIVLDWATQEYFQLKEGDTEGFVNLALSIKDVKMSLFLKEEHFGSKIRVSIRSKNGTSARECAARYFHGGGHELASGGKLIKGEDIPSIHDAESYIEKCTREFFSIEAQSESGKNE